MSAPENPFARYELEDDATRKLVLMSVEPNEDGTQPTLIGKCAGDGNPAFIAAFAKADVSARSALADIAKKQKDKKEPLTKEDEEKRQEVLAREQEEVARILADHCVIGWENMQNDAGEEVEFSKELLVMLLGRSRRILMLEVLNFFRDGGNFTKGALSRIEAQEVGNGSGSS